jgi:hypothetical protein
MSRWRNGSDDGPSGVPSPDRVPPGLNHCVLTGELTGEAKEGRSPSGEPVALLRIEFPVADLAHPRRLWKWASIGIEVPDDLAQRRAGELLGGAPVLVAGQVSERWVIEDGRSCRRGCIVAAHLHPGPLPSNDELLIPEVRP